MKRTLLTLIAAVAFTLSGNALGYEEAREQAWFLTDKMAYELNLTEDQYDRIYQINMDYFLNVASPSELFGYYWQCRQEDLRYILFDWQYSMYSAIDYFIRPMRWLRARWYFPVFDRYRRGYYYFERPAIYVSYRGGYWRRHPGGVSPYRGWRPAPGRQGMRHLHPRRGWADGHNDRRPQTPGTRPGSGYRPGDNSHARPGNGNRPGDNSHARPDHGNRPGDIGPGARPGNGSRPGSNGSGARPGKVTKNPGGSITHRNSGSRSFQTNTRKSSSGSGSVSPRSNNSNTRGASGGSRTSGSRKFGR